MLRWVGGQGGLQLTYGMVDRIRPPAFLHSIAGWRFFIVDNHLRMSGVTQETALEDLVFCTEHKLKWHLWTSHYPGRQHAGVECVHCMESSPL